MAKYVLMQFNDDTDADAFVQTMGNVVETPQATVRVIGVFKKPTLFCDCNVSNNDKSVRGEKWGWWLHRDCGKPRRGNVQHPTNLILPKEMPPGQKTIDHPYIGVKEPYDAPSG